MCASNAPTPMITSLFNPSRSAHSADIFPAGLSEVYVCSGNLDEYPLSNGSIAEKNSSGGNPLKSSAHNALCPAAHLLLFNWLISDCPVNKKGIQSQCSCLLYTSDAADER